MSKNIYYIYILVASSMQVSSQELQSSLLQTNTSGQMWLTAILICWSMFPRMFYMLWGDGLWNLVREIIEPLPTYYRRCKRCFDPMEVIRENLPGGTRLLWPGGGLYLLLNTRHNTDTQPALRTSL